ncbi:MAG TPA: HypC/HybG/HupF family hydrogenase formation chaperone [Ktedonobacteraceae bacterium]
MSNEQQARVGARLPHILEHESTLFPRRDPIYRVPSGTSCELDAEGHCVTCSDEALPARVLRVDQEHGLALASVKDTVEEIDITLVDSVAPGDILLVHGGVAIAHQGEASNE